MRQSPSSGRENAAVPGPQRVPVTVKPCPVSCFCAFLAIASGFLLLAFLALMPLIYCSRDPATAQVLIVTMIIVVILLAIAMLWWLLDPCCRPTRCELLRILIWVFTWALIVLGFIAMFCGVFRHSVRAPITPSRSKYFCA